MRKTHKNKVLALLLSVVMVGVCMITATTAVFAGGEMVAQIGEQKYATLAEALIAAESGDTIEILDGTWSAEAIGKLDEAGKYTNANIVRYKSLTIKAASGAKPTFTSNVSLGYDDSSTANAAMTVEGLKFDHASLQLSNYVQVTVKNCEFTNGTNATNGVLVVQDSACKNHKTTETYPESNVTIENVTIDGSNTGASGIRLRNTGDVTIKNSTVKNSKFNGILFESNANVDNTFAKNITVTGNTISEWNSTNTNDQGRGMRLALGTLAEGSTVNINNNTLTKETLGLDTPDFMKITGVGSGAVDISTNDWNNEPLDTVKDNTAYYTIDASQVIINDVASDKNDKTYVAQIGEVKYETLAEAIAAVPTDGTQTTIQMIADEIIPGNSGVTIAKTKNVVLDLNGYSVKNAVNENKTSQVIKNEGTLTIKDSSDENKDGTGTGLLENAIKEGTQPGEWWSKPQNNYTSNVITNCGVLTIESGKLINNAAGSISYCVDNTTNSNLYTPLLTINGGHLYNGYTSAIRMFCNSATKENKVVINGGLIEGCYAIWMQNSNKNANIGTLIVNDGEIRTTKQDAIPVETTLQDSSTQTYATGSESSGYNGSNLRFEFNGGVMNDNVAMYHSKSQFEITDGLFNGSVSSSTTGFITGGFFRNKHVSPGWEYWAYYPKETWDNWIKSNSAYFGVSGFDEYQTKNEAYWMSKGYKFVLFPGDGTYDGYKYNSDDYDVLFADEFQSYIADGYELVATTPDDKYYGPDLFKVVPIAKAKVMVSSGTVDNPEVTVVNLSCGGEFKVGKDVVLDAPTNVDGLEFLGWYDYADGKLGDLVSKDASYTFTASTDVNYKAIYKTTAKVVVDVESANADYGTVNIDGSASASTNIGSEVTVHAVKADGYKFESWKNEYGQIVSFDKDYKFAAVRNIKLTATFVSEDTHEALISYHDHNNNLLKAETYVHGTESDILHAVAPARKGQTFTGWQDKGGNKLDENALAQLIKEAADPEKSQHNIVNVYAIYEAHDTYSINLILVDDEDTEISSTTSDNIAIGHATKCTAPATVIVNNVEKYFQGFYVNNECVATTLEYAINPDTPNTYSVYAKYGMTPLGSEAVHPTLVVDGPIATYTNAPKISTTITWALPDGCTLVEAGYHYGKTSEMNGYKVGTLTSNTGSYTLHLSVKVDGAGYNSPYYIQPFVKYIDANGNIQEYAQKTIVLEKGYCGLIKAGRINETTMNDPKYNEIYAN